MISEHLYNRVDSSTLVQIEDKILNSTIFAAAVFLLCREYPCDHYTSVINVTLLMTGCPRVDVHTTAVQLLQVLDKRFFGNVGPLQSEADKGMYIKLNTMWFYYCYLWKHQYKVIWLFVIRWTECNLVLILPHILECYCISDGHHVACTQNITLQQTHSELLVTLSHRQHRKQRIESNHNDLIEAILLHCSSYLIKLYANCAARSTLHISYFTENCSICCCWGASTHQILLKVALRYFRNEFKIILSSCRVWYRIALRKMWSNETWNGDEELKLLHRRMCVHLLKIESVWQLITLLISPT